jgi:predicted DNA-binding transcriptional regulator YafY
VRFRAGGALEMCWHLFTWGDEVEVIEPRRLRTTLTHLASVVADLAAARVVRRRASH